jgi:outer membrane protein assembly factor BamB
MRYLTCCFLSVVLHAGEAPTTAPIIPAGEYQVGTLNLPAGERAITLHLSLRAGAVVVAHGILGGDAPALLSHDDGNRASAVSWWDATALRLTEGRLHGTLKLRTTGNIKGLPTAWDIDAAISDDGALSGTIAGAPAQGRLRRAAALDAVATSAAWPGYDGPEAGRSTNSGLRLVDRLDQAQLVWLSECRIGGGRGPVGMALPTADGQTAEHRVYGGLNCPVLADGKLMFHTVRPRTDRLGTLTSRKDRRTDAPIRGDFVAYAIDAASGATAWEQVIPDSELALYYDKHACADNTGVVAGGLYIAMGWTYRLHAFDLATGALRWSSAIEPQHGVLEAKRQQLNGAAPYLIDNDYRSLVAAGGVVVAAPRRVGKSVAFDLNTGRQLWTLDGLVQRCVVDGAERLLLATQRQVALIDPASGTALWTAPVAGNPWGAPAVAHGWYVAGAEGSKTAPTSGKLTTYRLGAAGLTQVWERTGLANVLRPVIAADTIIIGTNGAGGARSTELVACEAATGTPRATFSYPYEKWDSFFARLDDRVLWVVDGTHSTMPSVWLDAATLQRLGERDWHPALAPSSGYDRVWTYPYADGRLFIRGRTQFACYDLRRQE